MSTAQKFSVKYKLSQAGERTRFKRDLLALSGIAWEEKPEQYCEYRLDGAADGKNAKWCRAKQYTNGTLYLEAAEEELLTRMTGLLSAKPQTAVSASGGGGSPTASGDGKPSGLLDIKGTYVGTDESGKGDYFGPLVIAGVVATEETVPLLRAEGVMDSKKLGDKAIAELSAAIIRIVGEASVSVVEMTPQKYNELYVKFQQGGKNLNHLLAWGHARVIENLLEGSPHCAALADVQAVADQFGSEHYIVSQLGEKGKRIKLHQTPRAEANVGVAAASIIARNQFVKRIKKLSAEFGVNLPLGAGPQVKVQAKRFVERHGLATLSQVAKLHFKTTQEL